jgi:DNA-binding NtrC family response regulator
LATIYGVVAQNGGWVEASSAVGRGTTFEIYLPRYVGRAVHQKDARANSLGTVGRETILLVEDEPMLLTLTKRALQELGYRVIPAASPDAALRIAKSRDTPIHLLLTDIVMPGMNGRELAKLVRAELPRTAQLFMSGYSAGTLHGVEASDDDPDFLAKPFTITSLATKVRRALESTRV